MNFDTYQTSAMETAIYPTSSAAIYPTLLLTSEAGEVAGKIQKLVRKGKSISDWDAETINNISAEIGDVLWACAALAHDLGLNLSTIASANLAKLSSRAERGVIEGNGDNR